MLKAAKAISNYRAISILSPLSKILEKCLHSQLLKHLTDNNLLTPTQHGFRPAHSTTTALLSFTNTVYKALDAGILTSVILLDLSKAFDTVSHSKLLLQLETVNCSQHMLSWFHNDLHNRKQSVRWQSKQSNYLLSNTGIPQGFVLGPLLFNIFINNLYKASLQSTLIQYADDSTIITSSNNISDLLKFTQNAFTSIESWHNDAQLLRNPKKSKLLLFTTRLLTLDFKIFSQNNTEIEIVKTAKLLDITIDDKLFFENHILSQIKMTHFKLGKLYRHKFYLDKSTKLKLANSLLLPSVLYGCPIFTNLHTSLLNKLQSCYYKMGLCYIFELSKCRIPYVR